MIDNEFVDVKLGDDYIGVHDIILSAFIYA